MGNPSEEARSLGSYGLLRRLGSGGMAEVYMAAQWMSDEISRPVVIKAIHRHLAENERFTHMFLREVRIASLLQHPHLVHIYDVTVLDERPSIVMEFLRGRDLWTMLQRASANNGAFAPELAAVVALQVARGLHYAHHVRGKDGDPLNLVHRDVSPHNILVTRSGVVKLVDFGIAKSDFHQTQTESGIIKGKLPYMSPEQARGTAIDHRADQFSLGVVLWEMLTGQRLFARNDPYQTMAAVFQASVPSPSIVRPVPEKLEAIVLKSLSANVDDRYADCEAFARDLQRWLSKSGTTDHSKLLSAGLERLVPTREDLDFYRADEEMSGGDQPFWIGNDLSAADLDQIVVDAADAHQDAEQRLAKAQRLRWIPSAVRRYSLVAAAAIGVVMLAVGVGYWYRYRPVEAFITTVVPEEITLSMDGPVEIEFIDIPAGVSLEIDETRVESGRIRVVPSEEIRRIRAMREGKEVWRYDAVFSRPTSVKVPDV